MISPALTRFARKTDVVVVHRSLSGARDRQGNPTWTAAGEDVYPGHLTQETSREIVLGRETVIDQWRLLLRAGALIDVADQVRVGTRLYEVEGTPAVITTGAGAHHVEALLRFVRDVGDA
jgi:hypothetical protein